MLKKTFGEVKVEMRVYAGEYAGEGGLELAQAELWAFKAEHGRLPKVDDKEMYRIKTVIRRREWVSFEINTWNDLLRKTFGKVNTEMGIYTGKRGLERAVAELRAFKAEYNRLPKYTDKGMIGIIGAIRRKEWVPFGINIWNDLLEKTFGNVFSKKELYAGEKGLEQAVAELLAFKAAHARLPKARDKEMGRIKAAIARGEWASFGINKWNDLLRKTFGEVNVERGIYTGEQGLELATAELRAFKAEHGRLPKRDDKIGRRVIKTISRREWVSVGIKRWNDLLRKTFGEVNNEMGIYAGDQGLDRAIAELRAFKDKHGRLPKYSDKELCGIFGAVRRLEWFSIGIEKWNDLLMKTFGTVDMVKTNRIKKEKY